MPETINWAVTFDVVLGPRIAAAGTQTIDAYDKISIQLAADSASVDVDVQPSDGTGDVQLLVITASSYETQVTFSADEGATPPFLLDGPVVLIGTGAVKLLADPPQTLRFNNAASELLNVDILVGRQAQSVPEGPP